MGLAALGAGRLDHVGVDGALGEELNVVQLAGFCIEHVDKRTTDDLALLLWIGLALEVTEELCLGVGANHLDAHVLGEHGHHLVTRSEEHTSELKSLMRISYDVFCFKQNKEKNK